MVSAFLGIALPTSGSKLLMAEMLAVEKSSRKRISTDTMSHEGTDMQQCSYCGGDCPQSYMTGACDGFLGDIDGLDQDSMTDKLDFERENDESCRTSPS